MLNMLVRINQYQLESPKVTKKRKILVMSDIHNNEQVLDKLLSVIKLDTPDYLCLVGDIVEYNNDNIDKLLVWLKELSYLTNVIITYGNHENVARIKDKWVIKEDNNLYHNTNCHVLNKPFDQIIIDNISFYAINMPITWYQYEKSNKPFFNKFINNISIPQYNHLNILLSHSPKWFIHKNKIVNYQFLKEVDLILSGHNHGGLVPRSLTKIVPFRIGFGPYYTVIKNAYGHYYNNDKALIISSGITKLAKVNKPVHHLNQFYLPDIEEIILIPSQKTNFYFTKSTKY